MINFFKTLRKSMLNQGKTFNYLKYAIGEIALVVIGILIALQINNWNQNRQQKAQFASILKSVKEDLKTDTIMAAQIIKFYDTIGKYSHKVMTKGFNQDSLKNCAYCTNLITIYQPMTVQKKGYQQLQNFTDVSQVKTDSLTTEIAQFYAIFDNLISNNNQMLKKEVIENLDFFKKQDWFLNWIQGEQDPRISAYFGESQDYKNRVAAYNILSAKNHQQMLKVYKVQATNLLGDIEKRLGKNP